MRYITRHVYVMFVTVRHRQCKSSIIFGRTAGNIHDRVHNLLKTLSAVRAIRGVPTLCKNQESNMSRKRVIVTAAV